MNGRGDTPWFFRVVVGLLLISGAYSVYLSQTNPLDEDEMYQLHQGWEIANGYVPFVDFDAFSVCTAALASLGFRAAGDRFAGVRLNRGLTLLFYLGGCWLIYRIGALFVSRRAALLCVFAWMSLGHVILKSHEFRPIHISLFFSLAALYVYFSAGTVGSRQKSAFFAIGVLSGLAFLVKADSVILFGSILLVETGSRIRSLDRAWLLNVLLACAGALCVPALFLAALGDPERIWRYLFFQFRFLFYVVGIVETTWQKAMVFRWEFVLPLAAACVPGVVWLSRRLQVPRFRRLAAWMLVYGAMALFSLAQRPIYYQHNLFFPSLVPVLLAGFGLGFVLRQPGWAARAVVWVIAGAMAAGAAVSVYRWNVEGIVGSKDLFHGTFQTTFPAQPLCGLSPARVFEAPEVFREEKPSCKLSLEDHERLFRFLSSLEGEGLTVYDGFEAALPVRGVSYLNGFVLNAFHEGKYQRAYDLIRSGQGFLLRRMLDSGWRLFEDMSPAGAWEALVGELERNPPAVLMMDSFVWKLAENFPAYRAFVEQAYDFILVSEAHSVVGLLEGAARPPVPVGECAH